ncbi:sensor histidine kinase [Frankia gtarii]|uniref:sensor histidine kinase n=1 Tax=Frankia gtarii TaxID=2950102 RepID=UPI0021C2091C|nr:sensor histidine kinase [Frankia gtarii]
MLHRWYAAAWLVLGPVPAALAVWNDSGAAKYWSLALSAVLGLAYGLVAVFPDNPLLRPRTYLYLLVPGLGMMAYLPGGGAALFIVTLPQFWIFTGGPRHAISYSGAAAAATVVGSAGTQGWSPDFRTGNVVATLVGYAASVLLGLWVYKLVEQSEQRARRLSGELERAQLQLAEAHRREGATDERDRIAREIHDTIAQGLASIVVLAEAARTGLDSDPEKSAQQLRSIENTARENLAEARVLVGTAPHSGVAPDSVARALQRTLDRFAEDTGLAVNAELADVECDQPVRIALLRCTQESLANVRKHAGAATVGVLLARYAHAVELEITDDGRGFVVENSRGFGLDGMRKRLAEFGGELTVTSAVGEGTRVLAMIPTNDQV